MIIFLRMPIKAFFSTNATTITVFVPFTVNIFWGQHFSNLLLERNHKITTELKNNNNSKISVTDYHRYITGSVTELGSESWEKLIVLIHSSKYFLMVIYELIEVVIKPTNLSKDCTWSNVFKWVPFSANQSLWLCVSAKKHLPCCNGIYRIALIRCTVCIGQQ